MPELNKTYIYELMSIFIYDYLSPDGVEKVIGQQIVISPDLIFSASTSINYRGLPFYKFTFGLGFTLCKNSFAMISAIYGKEVQGIIKYPFNDYNAISYDYFVRYSDKLHILDKTLKSIINRLLDEHPKICYHWLRFFEYSYGFVILHELGHFLNGHSNYFRNFTLKAYQKNIKIRREYHIAELQCDIFATQLILNSKSFNDISKGEGGDLMNLGGDKWLKCVTFSIFSIFILLERLDLNQDTSTHPKAIIRIGNAFKHILQSYRNNTTKRDIFEAKSFLNNLLDEFKKINKNIPIETTDWKESISILFDGIGYNYIKDSNMIRLIFLQMYSRDFRYKLRDVSISNINKLSFHKVYKDIFKLITLSGNHIPWSTLNNHESFIKYSFYLIDFTNKAVIHELIHNKNHYIFGTKEGTINLISEKIKSKNMNINEIKNQIIKVSNLDIDELYARIGSDLLTSGTMRVNPEDSEKENIDEKIYAKLWFDKFKDVFQKKICESNLYYVFITNDNHYDKIMLCASIADLISSICIGVSPIVVAILIMKTGLADFCKNFHNDDL